MQKHLLRYPWIIAAMIAGILACIFLLYMLLFRNSAPEVPSSDVILVKEAIHCAPF